MLYCCSINYLVYLDTGWKLSDPVPVAGAILATVSVVSGLFMFSAPSPWDS